ncbi:hypothetical protein GCM10010429_46980 [Micromonospora olivasterospora]
MEPRRRAWAYVRGLLAPLERRNGWTLAEQAGQVSPDGLQGMLCSAAWDRDAVRDDVRDYVVEQIGDAAGRLSPTTPGSSSSASAGVQRQYPGPVLSGGDPGRGRVRHEAACTTTTRSVPLIEEVRPIVARRLDSVTEPQSRLFAGPRGGRISTAALRDATHRDEVVTKLGYEYLRRHDLRHTGLTWMADAGVPVHVLRKIAGHGSLTTTQRYLHPDRQAYTDAGAALSAHLKARRSPRWSPATHGLDDRPLPFQQRREATDQGGRPVGGYHYVHRHLTCAHHSAGGWPQPWSPVRAVCAGSTDPCGEARQECGTGDRACHEVSC